MNNKQTLWNNKLMIKSIVVANLVALFFPNTLPAENKRSTGSFKPAKAYTIKSIPLRNSIQAFTLGDFNGDGLEDIAVLEKNKKNIVLYYAKTSFDFYMHKRIRFRNSILDLKATNFNADKNDDLILLFDKNHTLASYQIKSNGVLALKGYIVSKKPGVSIERIHYKGRDQILVVNQNAGVERYALLKKGWFEFKEAIFKSEKITSIKPIQSDCKFHFNNGVLCLAANAGRMGIIGNDENNEIESVMYSHEKTQRPYLLEELNGNFVPELLIGTVKTENPISGDLSIKYDFGIETGQQDKVCYSGALPEDIISARLNPGDFHDLIMIWKQNKWLRILYDSYSADQSYYCTIGLPKEIKEVKTCDLDADQQSEIFILTQDGRSLYVISSGKLLSNEVQQPTATKYQQVKLPIFSKPNDLAVYQSGRVKQLAITHDNSSLLTKMDYSNDEIKSCQIDVGFNANQVWFLDARHVLCLNAKEKKLALIRFQPKLGTYQQINETAIGVDFFKHATLRRFKNQFLLTLIDKGNKRVDARTVQYFIAPGSRKSFKRIVPKTIPLNLFGSQIVPGKYGFYVYDKSLAKLNYIRVAIKKSGQVFMNVQTPSWQKNLIEPKSMKMVIAGDFEGDYRDDLFFLQNNHLYVGLSSNKKPKKYGIDFDQASTDDYMTLFANGYQKQVLGYTSNPKETIQEWRLLDVKRLKSKPLVHLDPANISQAVFIDNQLIYLNQTTNTLDILNFLN